MLEKFLIHLKSLEANIFTECIDKVLHNGKYRNNVVGCIEEKVI